MSKPVGGEDTDSYMMVIIYVLSIGSEIQARPQTYHRFSTLFPEAHSVDTTDRN